MRRREIADAVGIPVPTETFLRDGDTFTFGDIERKLSKKRRFIPTEDVKFMEEHVDGQWKMTLPTPARVRPEMLLKLNPAAVIQELAERGLRRIFIFADWLSFVHLR